MSIRSRVATGSLWKCSRGCYDCAAACAIVYFSKFDERRYCESCLLKLAPRLRRRAKPVPTVAEVYAKFDEISPIIKRQDPRESARVLLCSYSDFEDATCEVLAKYLRAWERDRARR